MSVHIFVSVAGSLLRIFIAENTVLV